jgi:hypothetical protein
MATKNSPLILNTLWFKLSLVKEIMNMKKLNVTLAILVAAVMAGNAQTSVTSDIVGYSKLTINQGGRLIAPVFHHQPVYSGSSTITSGVLAVSGLTPGSLNETAFSDRPNFPTYYVKITSSGVYQGLVLDVVSNTDSSITVAGAPSDLTGAVSVQVIRHYTLQDLANQSTDLIPYQDAVTFYDAGNLKRTYYYDGAGFIADDYATPASQVVVYPGSGVILNAGSNSAITMIGNVNTTKTLVPIYAGESIVAPTDPSGITKVALIDLGPSMAAYSDAASVVRLDGSLATTTYYTDGIDMLDDTYTTITPGGSPVVEAGNGFIINAAVDGVWAQNPVISGN